MVAKMKYLGLSEWIENIDIFASPHDSNRMSLSSAHLHLR